jgi:hypothetical protein
MKELFVSICFFFCGSAVPAHLPTKQMHAAFCSREAMRSPSFRLEEAFCSDLLLGDFLQSSLSLAVLNHNLLPQGRLLGSLSLCPRAQAHQTGLQHYFWGEQSAQSEARQTFSRSCLSGVPLGKINKGNKLDPLGR